MNDLCTLDNRLFLLTTGNGVNCLLWKQFARCDLISRWSYMTPHGSFLLSKEIQNAIAYNPQSVPPVCLGTFLINTVTESFGFNSLIIVFFVDKEIVLNTAESYSSTVFSSHSIVDMVTQCWGRMCMNWIALFGCNKCLSDCWYNVDCRPPISGYCCLSKASAPSICISVNSLPGA